MVVDSAGELARVQGRLRLTRPPDHGRPSSALKERVMAGPARGQRRTGRSACCFVLQHGLRACVHAAGSVV